MGFGYEIFYQPIFIEIYMSVLKMEYMDVQIRRQWKNNHWKHV